MEARFGNSATPTRVMERGARADLWKNTLLRIPTLYGRLSYLASLLEPETGRYRHHGLAAVFGRNESNEALHDSHMEVFLEWLNLPLQGRHEDLKEYLSSLEERPVLVLRNLRRSRVYRNLVPLEATSGERKLFQDDLEMLLTLQQNAADSALPGSSPPE